MVLGVNGLPLGLGGGSHLVALVTDPWSNPLLITGIEVKAWLGVGMLCLDVPSAHNGGLDIWCLTAVQTAPSELTRVLPGEEQPSGRVPGRNAGPALAWATSTACQGQHLTILCPLPQWR